MGRELAVRCAACGDQARFFLGAGGIFASLDVLQDQLPSDRREEILALSRTCSPEEVHFGHGLFVCPSCNRLSGRFKVLLRPGGVTRYASKFFCETCGSQLLERNPLQVKKVPCIRCGLKKLKAEMAGC